jgi:hypothetical protein
MLSKKLLIAFAVILFLPMIVFAQVTTSNIIGSLTDSKKTPIEGANITAIHEPSGTTYSTVSKKNGNYTLPGLRTGGPYTIKITFVGFKTETINDVYLSLGESFTISTVLTDASQNLGNVVVITQQKRKLYNDKSGASTVVNQKLILNQPTISRNLSDFTKLTPQANGNSFAGRDGRYNNTVVDGANLNNNFGLSNDPLPGGGSNPISIDAIEEISVNISPYDVKQGNFTGASINAITKSGTNTFKGSAYTFYRNQNYNGREVGSVTLPEFVTSSNKIFGATLGGAIIKNKLFFFASYESEESDRPGITFSPTGGSGNGIVSSTRVDSLKRFSDHLKSRYGYDPGAYDNFPNFLAKNHKLLLKLDWNINNNNKLSVKYNELISENDQAVNGSSIPNNPSFTPLGGSSITRLPNNRFSNNSMSFANTNFLFKDIVRSAAFELNSSNKGKFSNQFLATFTKIQSTRIIPNGNPFPTIDIFNGAGQNYMSAGTDPFTRNNDVINDVFSITDNFTYYAGKHTITLGGSYEYQRVGNMFMPGSASYYAFNSLNDFITNRAPAAFSYTYALDPKQSSVYAAELKIGQLALYAQDEVNVSNNFKLIYGIRVDKPIYNEQPLANPNIAALSFPNKDGEMTNYSTGAWPKSTLYFSPRVGFRYKIPEENLVIRGGTGLFTGRIPFVFLTNIPTNSFMYQSGQAVTSPTLLQNYLFNPNPDAYRSNFSTTPGVLPTNANLVMADPNFKFPQVWRSNLAIEKNLGDGWDLTVEALFTKDLNAVVMRNANQRATNARLTGPDTRGRFAATADRRLYSNIGSAIILENADNGQSGSLTFQATKSTQSGFFASLAYTLSFASEVTANPGSQANSVWNSNATTATQNDLQSFNSAFVNPHRFIGNLSYKFNYSKYAATTISIFGELAKQNNYSYVYNGDINNDGNNTTDLMFITKDVLFVNQAASASTGITARTAAEQAAAWSQFIDNTPYLKNRVGQYAGRNEAYLPWYSRFDIKILQDFYVTLGKRKHSLQFSADILNAGNLFNNRWGVRQITTFNNPLIFRGYDASGRPTFNLSQIGGQPVTKPWQNNLGTGSTWGLQLGVKYIF